MRWTWLVVGGIVAVVALAIVDPLGPPEPDAPEAAPAVSTSTESEAPPPGPTSTATTESPTTASEPSQSPKQRIRQAGNQWAQLFAAGHDDWGCLLQTQPLCVQIGCTHPSCNPPSPEFRQSFADARVVAIVIKGRQAGARFSNGVAVKLVRIADGRWLVHRVGGKAGEKLFD
jgi:hypothetical protein